MIYPLDPLIPQANARLGKDELMTMVRFGADEIFKSKSATITDDDIDAILAQGEARTKEMQEKIKVG
jgi:SWI/SNF-related matrix-associated actin-dependent regulator of chromatin subfamily A member 5